MAKSKGSTRQSAASNGAPPNVPSGYQRRTNEVAGFWDPKLGPVHFIPRQARVFDGKIDPLKSSILIQGDSVGVNQLLNKDGEKVVCEQGEQIGVWYKPGMAPIKDLCGVPVYMYENGERDTGKGNPMKLYEVLSPKPGKNLFITGDYRKRSANTNLPFDIIAVRQEDVSTNEGAAVSDVPF